MSPQERLEFQKMQQDIKKIMDVLDVTFIENAKRRVVTPALISFAPLKKESTGGTSGVLRSVNEGGESTYNVADAFDGTITIQDPDGNSYKLGYYT